MFNFFFFKKSILKAVLFENIKSIVKELCFILDLLQVINYVPLPPRIMKTFSSNLILTNWQLLKTNHAKNSNKYQLRWEDNILKPSQFQKPIRIIENIEESPTRSLKSHYPFKIKATAIFLNTDSESHFKLKLCM